MPRLVAKHQVRNLEHGSMFFAIGLHGCPRRERPAIFQELLAPEVARLQSVVLLEGYCPEVGFGEAEIIAPDGPELDPVRPGAAPFGTASSGSLPEMA